MREMAEIKFLILRIEQIHGVKVALDSNKTVHHFTYKDPSMLSLTSKGKEMGGVRCAPKIFGAQRYVPNTIQL